jgi:lauroyl/myristoyl acyltransferase
MKREKRAVVTLSDLRKALFLFLATPVAWLTPPRLWRPLAAFAARLPVYENPKAASLQPGLLELLGGDAGGAFARLRAAYFQDCLLTLRAWAPWPTRTEVRLHGSDNLEAALGGGRGAIVWVAQTAAGPLVAKMALARAGHPPVHLTRPSHRFSPTRFGVKVLNPVQTRIEDRYLRERVSQDDAAPAAAFLRLRRRLRENALVSVTAGGEAAESVVVPFFGGGLPLPTGALHLALRTGAPILPLVVMQRGSAAFDVFIGPPLPLSAADPPGEAVVKAAEAWARHVEALVRQAPENWLGWLRAGGQPAVGRRLRRAQSGGRNPPGAA